MEAGGEPGTPTPEASAELRGALLTAPRPAEREDSITRLRLGIVPVGGTHTRLVQTSRVGLIFLSAGRRRPRGGEEKQTPCFRLFTVCLQEPWNKRPIS